MDSSQQSAEKCKECLEECAQVMATARRARSTEPIAEEATEPIAEDRRQEVGRELNVVPHCVCMCVWGDKEGRSSDIGEKAKRDAKAKSSRRAKCECACAVLVAKVPTGDARAPGERKEARIRALSSILEPRGVP